MNILDKGRISALEESEWVLITMGVRMIINKRIFSFTNVHLSDNDRHIIQDEVAFAIDD